MNRDSERSILCQTGDEGRQNGDLAEVALDWVVRDRTEECRIEKVGRFIVLGDEALGFEFLDGSLGALREKENVPILVTHPAEVSSPYIIAMGELMEVDDVVDSVADGARLLPRDTGMRTSFQLNDVTGNLEAAGMS